MPKKKPSQRKTTPAPRGTTSSLALSSLHQRLNVLREEHQWLLKQIQRKRTELSNFLEQMRAVGTEIFHRGAPVFSQFVALDREIHELFAEILSRKFGKQTRKKIVGIYQSLQMAGLISPKQELEDPEMEELDEFFETPPESADEAETRSPEDPGPSSGFGESQAASTRSPDARKIRQTFLRLAEIFHPDRVTDSETQARHTEIMKEINRAYKEQDFARLLEIERQHQQGRADWQPSEQNDLERECDRLAQDNQLLKTQYETIKLELRELRNTPEGATVSDYRRAKREGIDPIEEMLEQARTEMKTLEKIRDFVQNFRDKKMSVKDFLAGPDLGMRLSPQQLEDLLDEMFDLQVSVVRY